MKTKKEIEDKLDEILYTRELVYDPPADIYDNPRLCIRQTDLRARANILKWVLGIG